MRRLLDLLALGLLTATLSINVAHAEKRVALVIGNDRYVNLPSLQKAVNDAEAVGNTLAKLGFEVVRGRNLGRQGMIDKLSELTARLEAGDTAVFFYAGHGVAISNVNYLVPSDAPAATIEARVRGASISEPDIIEEIRAKGARVAFLVLDACRDNPFPRSGTRSVGNSRGLTNSNPARGVFVLYSAGSGQTALDRLEQNDPNRNSVFTRVFVDQLARPGLHLGDLAVEVREKVAEIAKRAKNDQGEPLPHEQTPAYYDQTIGGRIFLAGRSIAVEPAAPAKPTAIPQAQDEAARAREARQTQAEHAWAASKDTASQAILERFIARFDGTVYADLARARLEEIKRSRPAASSPGPVASLPPPAYSPPPVSLVQPDRRYPNRPVTIIVPFAPGGSTDIVARMIGQKLSDRSGQAFVVENRPGAGGAIGAVHAARAVPDGYTLFLGETAITAIIPSLRANPPYDTRRDFVAVGLIGASAQVLVVHPSISARSVAELRERIFANAHKYTCGTNGIGTLSDLTCASFAADVISRPVQRVPYRGSGPMLAGLLSGSISLAFLPEVYVASHVRSGKLRALAVTGAHRNAALSNVPTFAEAGMREFDPAHYYGLLAPRGTPAAVVERINVLLRQALDDSSIRASFARMGMGILGGSAAEHAATIERERELWSKVARSAGIRLN